MSKELEVWFDNGETGQCHTYPLNTTYTLGRDWVTLADKDGAVFAHYHINAINCIRESQ